MKRYASAAQLAEQFQIDESTVWRWVQRGLLPRPVKLSPGCSRFDLDEIDRRNAENAVPRKDVTRAVEASLRSQKRAESLERRRCAAEAPDEAA
jgi:prophage regulatory protein